ncbi:MAG: RluA family pseudouridine synthase [Clostridia bacterium]|nr:RluA family pseudouridine synthase [Clostridia bacterium]
MIKITIDKNSEGQKIEKFLFKILPEAGRTFLYKMIRKKRIKLNGGRIEGKETLVSGDEITFYFSDETYNKFRGVKEEIKETEMLFEVVYEDENILIVDKPAGVLMHPDIDNVDGTLIDSIYTYLGVKADDMFKPATANRLDRNTSGLVIVGKNLKSLSVLNELIKEKKIEKYYKTVVEGVIEKELTLEGSIEKDEKSNTSKISDEGKYIKTIVKPLSVKNGNTMLEINLITGRSHQIRVHLSSIGHPILGDAKYGSKVKVKKGQILHAYRLMFNTKDTMFDYIDGKEFLSSKEL